ncbi:MAG: hypothetical protein ACXWPI_13430 [Ktedonobacterales bacterium]
MYEHLGWSHRRSGDDSGAQRAFTSAVDAYDVAKRLLLACKADADKRDAAIERLALRQTKCHLLSWDREHADATMKELSAYSRLKDTRPVPLYNAACLFAVAMACPELPDDQRLRSEWHAWHFLGMALLCSPQGSGLWSRMMTEEELDMLDTSRRKSFRNELEKKHRRQFSYGEADPIVKAVIADLDVTGPAQGLSVSHFTLRRQLRRHQGRPARNSDGKSPIVRRADA